jgi:CHAD domain-containing protein
VIGKQAGRTAKSAERLQTVLGDHHDAVAAEEWLRLAALEGPLSASFEAGVLTARERNRQKTLRKEWQRPWGSLSSKRRRRWLTTH